MGPREIKRLSQMKGPNEPIEEEMKGLMVLGSVLGYLFGQSLLGSGLVGGMIGSQLGSVASFAEAPQGEQLRRAGWNIMVYVEQLSLFAEKSWRAVMRESQARGVTLWLRRRWAQAKDLDASTGASIKARALALSSLTLAQRAWSHACWAAERSGFNAKVRQLWRQSGLQKQVSDMRSRAVLNARIADMKRGRVP